MRNLKAICLSIFFSVPIFAQNKVNVACVDFTFEGKKSAEGNSLKKAFENALFRSNEIYNVVERDRMDIFFEKLQEEKNLYKDLNKVFKAPELVGVDYLVIGDFDLNPSLEKYKLNISFIKLTGEQVTTKLPLQVNFTKGQILDDDTIINIFVESIKEFTEAHFVTNGDNWIKAPNFYNELDKRDSIITLLRTSDSLRKRKEDELAALKSTTPIVYPFLVLEKDNKLYLHLQFVNNVPIKFDFFINKYNSNENVNEADIMEPPTLYPPKDGRDAVIDAYINLNTGKIPKDTISRITLHFSYQSIYYIETMNPKLKVDIDVSYVIDPIKKTINQVERHVSSYH
jgi:hypothetical protein